MPEPTHYIFSVTIASTDPDFPVKAARVLRRIAAERSDQRDKSQLRAIAIALDAKSIRIPRY